jgi:uncharacterized protein (TIGR03382 family)
MVERTTGNARIAQAFALLGLGLWFLAIPDSRGEGECSEEGQCTFLKPAVMLTLDYSTDMNLAHGQGTRWEATVDAVKAMMDWDNGFFQENMRIAVMRVGHDPNPGQPDTPIPGDATGILDGQALDVAWYDDNGWFDCNGAAVIDTLDQMPPPMDGQLDGIGAWQAGAVARLDQLVQQSVADHPEDADKDGRAYVNVVFVGSPWTGATGTGQPAQDDPESPIGALYQDHDLATYVVRVGDGLPLQEADAWADAGGTNAAYDIDDLDPFRQDLGDFVQQVKDDLAVPDCTPGLPRITVILDASSDMLNIDGEAAMMGETPWDLTAELLFRSNSELWDGEVQPWATIEDLSLTSLVVYGNDQPAPDEQRLVVPMGPCNIGGDAFGWATSPPISCLMPGCDDPWGGPDITWTFADADSDTFACWFDPETTSHMPQCHGDSLGCEGSGRFVHLGLEHALELQQAYHAEQTQMGAEQPADDGTQYYNLLVIGGSYEGFSSDAQVQSALEANLAAGVVTFVLAVGPAAEDAEMEGVLSQMADWGSAGAYPYYTPDSIQSLQQVLIDIVGSVEHDPCCGFPSCDANDWGEGCTMEPDPIPPMDTGGDTGGTTGGADEGPGPTTDTGETGDSGGSNTGTDDGTSTEGDSSGGGGASADSSLGRGCACGAAGGSTGFPWLLVLVAGLRRRRRSAGAGS